MAYQPNDPEFYAFMQAGMPDETLLKWLREGNAIYRRNENLEKDTARKAATRAYQRAYQRVYYLRRKDNRP